MDCIFCKIIAQEIPSYTIYEDEMVKVFLDIHPEVNGHMLIIPKKHFENICDIDAAYLSHINKVAIMMYDLVKAKLNATGITLIQNNGSSQEVKHYHLHLLPRYHNDGFEHKNISKLANVEEVYKLLN